MQSKMNRRLYGMLGKRLKEARLDEVCDPRNERGKRWALSTLLRCVIGGLMSGAHSLADVENLSMRLSHPMRPYSAFDAGFRRFPQHHGGAEPRPRPAPILLKAPATHLG